MRDVSEEYTSCGFWATQCVKRHITDAQSAARARGAEANKGKRRRTINGKDFTYNSQQPGPMKRGIYAHAQCPDCRRKHQYWFLVFGTDGNGNCVEWCPHCHREHVVRRS